jgi:putative sigma-54 modulation protein
MNIQVRKRNVAVTDVLRARVERRLGFALSRFADRIGRVMVRFSEKGHGAGADQRCQINVALRPQSLRVEDIDADLFAALDHAAARISRSVARALERERPS